MQSKIAGGTASRRTIRSAVGPVLLIAVFVALFIKYRAQLLPTAKPQAIVAPLAALPVKAKNKPLPRRKPATGPSRYRRWAVLVAEPLKSTGVADLLTVEMVQAGFELVERDQLAAVTAEQQTQAVAATDGRNRVQLGKLLKADALVLVSTRKEGDQNFVRLVISDTRWGARLRVTEFPAGDAAAAVKAIAGAARDTRDQFTGGVKWVVAVPHFISKDLAHDLDHLQSGFATLLENSLSTTPGVAVLEMEEAQSISTELEIGNENVDRVVPLFVTGTYETARSAPSTAATRRSADWPVNVTLSVQVTDGVRAVGTFDRKGIPLASVNEVISREMSASILGLKLDELTPLDEDQQFSLLVSRADAFAASAAWDHSLAVREAALLVMPSNIEQRTVFVREAAGWNEQMYQRARFEKQNATQAYWDKTHAPVTDWHTADPSLTAELNERLTTFEKLWRRSLDHIEWLARHQQREGDLTADRLLFQWAEMGRQLGEFRTSQSVELAASQREVEQETRAAFEELGPVLAGPQVTQAARERAWNFVGYYVKMASRSDLPLTAQWIENARDDASLWQRLVNQLANIERLTDAAVLLHPTEEVDYPGLVAVLLKSQRKSVVLMGRVGQLWIDDKTEGSSDPSGPLRDRAAALERELNALSAEDAARWSNVAQSVNFTNAIAHLSNRRGIAKLDQRALDLPAKAPAQRSGVISYQLVPLHVKTVDGFNPLLQQWDNQFGEMPQELTFAPCAANLDVVWNRYAVFLHREAGILEPVLIDGKEHARDVAWDGEHIWAASGSQGIHILESTGKVVAQVSAAQGLPPADQRVFIRVLGPGRVFVCGSFGEDRRGWFAIVERSPAGAIGVNVFHRAVKMLPSAPAGGNLNPQGEVMKTLSADPGMCFEPLWIALAPPGPDSPAGAVWSRRDSNKSGAVQGNHLLHADLATLQVTTVPFAEIYRLSPLKPPTFLDSERALVNSSGKMFEVSLVGKPLSNGKPWRFVFQDSAASPFENPRQLLNVDGHWYLPGPEWFRFDLTTLSARRIGAGAKWGGLPLGGSDEGYCRSNVCGVIGWNTYAVDFVQISLDDAHPLATHADDSKGPIEQHNQPQRPAGRIDQYQHGQILTVDESHEEFYAGRGCLVVLGTGTPQRKYGIIEPELYRSEEEEEWLALVERTLEFPEEQQRLGLTPEHIQSLKQLPSRYGRQVFNPQSQSTTRPTAFRELRGWTNQARFRGLVEAYEKAAVPDKKQARNDIFSAVREAGDERQRLAAQTIAEVKRILTPAQVKAIRFEAP